MSTEKIQEKLGIIGKSKGIKDLVDIVLQVAKSDISVLLTGESGVGKEIFANAIHTSSSRANKKLVSVNCGAIPEGILESELFGHEKGSFTGATDDRKGYFEIADGGTLFLDEIAEMPLTTQVKLLRVLETNEFMRLGSEKVTKVDVRIICATNKNLQHEVDNKKFRKDLFFRLKAVTLTIPELRERKEDIISLAEFMLKNYSERMKLPPYIFSKDAHELFTNYYWPGNVRELKNVIETGAALSKNSVLTSESFLPHLSSNSSVYETKNLPVHLDRSSEELDREMIYRALIEIKRDLIHLKNMAGKYNGENIRNTEDALVHEIIPLASLEKKAIINTLEFTKWNKKKAAELLKISERTLYRKLKDYEIQ
ncbi:MAG: sigma-54 dependent transcriptional regulator [Bacteroidetes bacterium]|nr:sigma-54 dependent transcriptional regulator [Bacteroidota bacterium]